MVSVPVATVGNDARVDIGNIELDTVIAVAGRDVGGVGYTTSTPGRAESDNDIVVARSGRDLHHAACVIAGAVRDKIHVDVVVAVAGRDGDLGAAGTSLRHGVVGDAVGVDRVVGLDVDRAVAVTGGDRDRRVHAGFDVGHLGRGTTDAHADRNQLVAGNHGIGFDGGVDALTTVILAAVVKYCRLDLHLRRGDIERVSARSEGDGVGLVTVDIGCARDAVRVQGIDCDVVAAVAGLDGHARPLADRDVDTGVVGLGVGAIAKRHVDRAVFHRVHVDIVDAIGCAERDGGIGADAHVQVVVTLAVARGHRLVVGTIVSAVIHVQGVVAVAFRDLHGLAAGAVGEVPGSTCRYRPGR